MEMKNHLLEVNVGHIVNEGKSYWPDCVEITVPRDIAITLMAQLSSMLQPPEEKNVKISLTGTLHCNTEE